MALFANGFSGDAVSLQHILDTLNAKSYVIPGITANQDLTVSAMGEVAYFYTRGATSTGEGTVGSKLDYKSTGVKRIDIPMTSALTIEAVLPRVNFATVSADVVGDKVIQESIALANRHNELALEALVAGAEAKTSEGAGAYEQIVNAVKTFKVDNKANALRPASVIVSSEFYAELLVDNRFIRPGDLGDLAISEAIVGRVAGMFVVEAPDLDEGFILIDPEGFAAPRNINTLVITDGTAAGYPLGTIIAGETGYGFKVIKKADDASLADGSYMVAHFTSL